ncbi:MAG: TonB family protein [Terriglobales bacterium]
MSVLQPNPLFPEKAPSEDLRELERNPGPQRKAPPDDALVLATLKQLVAAGEHQLDPMLAAIADAALVLTGASGVALAMWKDGAMLCRARSGETAPALGARLSADKGISGECLRKGKAQHCADTETNSVVDREVCRALGLRSISALPIQGRQGISGILEAFSTKPSAFTARQLGVLEQLAALAEKARALEPATIPAEQAAHPAEAQGTAAEHLVPAGVQAGAPVAAIEATAPEIAEGLCIEPAGIAQSIEEPARRGFLPASDRVIDFVSALLHGRRRPFVLAGAGLVAVLLLVFVAWLGWRGPKESVGKAHAAASAVAPSGGAARLPDNDSIWKPNPGGERVGLQGVSAAGGKTASKDGSASKEGNKEKRSNAQPAAPASDVTVISNPKASATPDGKSAGTPARSAQTGDAGVVAPALVAEQMNPSGLGNLLLPTATMPSLSVTVSQGVSGGQLLHRVSPAFPAQAKTFRLEGQVVLEATVLEDGHLRDVKVVQGPPVFAQAALDAVKQWRYSPFLLDGKPVKTPTRITVDFKLPSGSGPR